jgi:hypothetical protein
VLIDPTGLLEPWPVTTLPSSSESGPTRRAAGSNRISYTGSTGYGQDCVDSLVGHIGHIDVASVLAAQDYLIQCGLGDPQRQFIEGLSHGGFLAYVLGQRDRSRFTW